jgi:nitrate reductase NapE component
MSYFIDAFQGWFKNGTDATSYDYRLVFAVFPVIKILCALWASIFTGMEHRGSRIWLIPSMVLHGVGLFFALFRPYQHDSMNKLDSLILWLLGTIAFTQVNSGEEVMHFTLALAYFPVVCVITYAAYKFCYWAKRQVTMDSCSCLQGNNRPVHPPLLSSNVLESELLKLLTKMQKKTCRATEVTFAHMHSLSLRIASCHFNHILGLLILTSNLC